MLTGNQIVTEVEAGRITISDFSRQQVGPNSYDLHWGDSAKEVLPNHFVFTTDGPVKAIDMRQPPVVREIPFSYDGTLLLPNRLYLIATKEVVGSNYFIPQIVGRSSIGRMGISVCQEASFGDLGFIGNWTLQVSVLHPTLVFPHMRVCQVFFEEPFGDIGIQYQGRYNYAEGAIPSRFAKKGES